MLEFIYKNSRGEIKTFNLHQHWREEGKYVIGFDSADEKTKSFLKFRVIEYLTGIENLSDPYPSAPPQIIYSSSRSDISEILFTGFPQAQRDILEEKARNNKMKVVKSVTANLMYLCGGPNAGPSKLSAARLKGSYILSPISFLNLIETGELPDHDVFD